MKICFYGAGGVGGYFGALVSDFYKNKHDIYFIARGKHKEAICNNGLTLKKAGGQATINAKPKLCTDNVNDLPVCDIIILSVKSYDLKNAVKDIAKITTNNTIVLPLLNGVDIYDRIRENLKEGIVLPSCVYVGTHIESPGVVYQKGGSCKILMGNDPQKSNTDISLLTGLFEQSLVNFELHENVQIAIWSKFMFIAAYGLVTASSNKCLGEVYNDAELSISVKNIMQEIDTIARKIDIPLDCDIIEKSFLKASDFPYEAKTSFQRDVEAKGKINEGDLFGGTLLLLGKKNDVDVSETQKVYQNLISRL